MVYHYYSKEFSSNFNLSIAYSSLYFNEETIFLSLLLLLKSMMITMIPKSNHFNHSSSTIFESFFFFVRFFGGGDDREFIDLSLSLFTILPIFYCCCCCRFCRKYISHNHHQHRWITIVVWFWFSKTKFYSGLFAIFEQFNSKKDISIQINEWWFWFCCCFYLFVYLSIPFTFFSRDQIDWFLFGIMKYQWMNEGKFKQTRKQKQCKHHDSDQAKCLFPKKLIKIH